jgi:hypothetical protein
MSVTPVQSPGRPDYSAEIEKIVSSSTLHGSESLCKLLRYLAQHAIRHPGTPLKEYQIATEVFGRPSNFDPHLDSTIRVQAGRLRLKLSEYYAKEGTQDPVVVELPKGTYVLNFHTKTGSPPPTPVEKVRRLAPVASPARTKAATTDSPYGSTVLVALLAFFVGCFTVWAFRPVRAVDSPAPAIPQQLKTFWSDFVVGQEEPWVVFSNGAFIGRPETGMRYFDPTRDSRDKILDHYTGVGEVLAIHELDRVFNLFNRNIRVKRGSMLSLDDAKNNNLIFVGSPAENPSLLELPGSREFVFRRMETGPRKGDLGVLNLHPRDGEPGAYLATSGPPLTEDYEVITLVNGLTPGRHTLILAGTTTLGTEAAVEFVCRQDSLQQLLSTLGVANSGEVKPFEAVLRTRVTRGVPVETQLVSIRQTSP